MSKSQESWRLSPRFALLALLAAGLLAVGFSKMAEAEDPVVEDPAVEEAAEEAVEEEPDMYTVPDTEDLETLGEFINTLQTFQPTTRAEYMEWQEKAGDALATAAEKVMSLEPAEGTRPYQLANGVMLQMQLPGLFTSETAERQALVDEVLAHLAATDQLGIPEARLSMQLAQMLGYVNEPEMNADTLEKLVAIFDAADSDMMAEVAASLESMLRRAQLIGNEMEITGTTLDGEDFNIESLRGQVVLVDFWATWCGPCVGEHPNIMANYEKYHDQGFEVVGISLDQDRKALVDYIAEHEVPWITLHGENGANPAAEEYSIDAIPAMFLLDTEGKVISDQARGEELTRLLAEIFEGDGETPAEGGEE